MDCREFDGLLHDLDRPGGVPAEKNEAALDHAEACPRCAALLNEVESLDFALRSLAEQTALQQADKRVEEHLLHELRRSRFSLSRARVIRTLAVLGTAAAILIASFYFLRPVAPGGNSVPTAGRPVPPVAAPAGLPPTTTPAQNNAPDEWLASEDASGFVQLPGVASDASMDSVAIVRVTLPRAALASFGFPVMDDRDSGPVAADLLLAQDGTPEAIRLITTSSSVGSTKQN